MIGTKSAGGRLSRDRRPVNRTRSGRLVEVDFFDGNWSVRRRNGRDRFLFSRGRRPCDLLDGTTELHYSTVCPPRHHENPSTWLRRTSSTKIHPFDEEILCVPLRLSNASTQRQLRGKGTDFEYVRFVHPQPNWPNSWEDDYFYHLRQTDSCAWTLSSKRDCLLT